MTVVSIYFIYGVGRFDTVDNFLNSPGIRQSIRFHPSDVSSLYSIVIQSFLPSGNFIEENYIFGLVANQIARTNHTKNKQTNVQSKMYSLSATRVESGAKTTLPTDAAVLRPVSRISVFIT